MTVGSIVVRLILNPRVIRCWELIASCMRVLIFPCVVNRWLFSNRYILRHVQFVEAVSLHKQSCITANALLLFLFHGSLTYDYGLVLLLSSCMVLVVDCGWRLLKCCSGTILREHIACEVVDWLSGSLQLPR